MSADENKPQWQIDQERRLYFTQPLDKSEPEYLAFIKKSYFTIREFATLLAGLRPWVFDDSPLAEEIYQRRIKTFVQLLQEGIEAFVEEWYSDTEEFIRELDPDYVKSPYFVMCGYPSYSVGDRKTENIVFHVAVYVAFCKEKYIPLPFPYNEADYSPRPRLLDQERVKEKSAIKEDEKKEKIKEIESTQTSAVVINPLANYLDPNSADYAPRLAILPEILRRVEAAGVSINDGKKFALGEGRNLLDGELKAQAEKVFRETFKTEIPKTLLKAYADILWKKH